MKLLLGFAAAGIVAGRLKGKHDSFPFHGNLSSDSQCSNVKDKIDCGHVGTQQPDCEASGCCWQPSEGRPRSVGGNGDPWCFYKSGAAPSCPLNYTSTGAPFSDDEVSKMRGYFLQNINIQGSGAVVASPDHNTPGGSYYYHWERDGALSTGALLRTADSVEDVKTQMDAYASWVKNVQAESDPHGQSVLSEPKYLIPGGQVYPDPWCRPQNDGPGLRSHTLIKYANALEEVRSPYQQHSDVSLRVFVFFFFCCNKHIHLGWT